MSLSVGMITFDTDDPITLGRWWAQQVDGSVVAAGATRLSEHTMADFVWVTLADPAGDVFCVSGTH